MANVQHFLQGMLGLTFKIFVLFTKVKTVLRWGGLSRWSAMRSTCFVNHIQQEAKIGLGITHLGNRLRQPACWHKQNAVQCLTWGMQAWGMWTCCTGSTLELLGLATPTVFCFSNPLPFQTHSSLCVFLLFSFIYLLFTAVSISRFLVLHNSYSKISIQYEYVHSKTKQACTSCLIWRVITQTSDSCPPELISLTRLLSACCPS